MRNLETAAPPTDLEVRRIQVTLAESGPRYVSTDLEFAGGLQRSARVVKASRLRSQVRSAM
jgi:hypothetical protein